MVIRPCSNYFRLEGCGVGGPPGAGRRGEPFHCPGSEAVGEEVPRGLRQESAQQDQLGRANFYRVGHLIVDFGHVVDFGSGNAFYRVNPHLADLGWPFHYCHFLLGSGITQVGSDIQVKFNPTKVREVMIHHIQFYFHWVIWVTMAICQNPMSRKRPNRR